MKVLLDTNILVHSYNRSSPHQEKASRVIRKALKNKLTAYLTPQILYEFSAVITNPKRVENPLSPHQASEICLDLWQSRSIKRINASPNVPKEVLQLVGELKISRAKIFDCRIAVIAKENNVNKIYTENTEDFKQYKFIKAENPLE